MKAGIVPFPQSKSAHLCPLSEYLMKGFGCTFPEDAVSSTGALFWSASKRF